jgi:hypothetical protein
MAPRCQHAGRRHLGGRGAPLIHALGRLPLPRALPARPRRFQVGIGVTLLLALAWRDAATVALTGFLVANSLHAVSHAIDLDLGGRGGDPYVIGAVSLLAAAALVLRVRQRRTSTPVSDNRQAEPR